ncbi:MULTISPECIES: hypothetical protein [Saccharothrix]|uniref:hypothetical protein n=1 Tax=Saccharothrix TaxID=2071 RepID=UPI0009403D5B|nr:hypothetical protein [Saccharothrix sp. CB00851]OKI18665.1 hypothetical protein A6A25_39645 [Saccharothrix sp. CB00851]
MLSWTVVLRRSAGWLALPLSLGLAIFALTVPEANWRFEWGRSMSAAGLYLFIASPLYAGLASFDTVFWRNRTAQVAEGIRDRDLIARLPWLCTAAIGLAVHAVVLLAIAVTAAVSGAVGAVHVEIIVVQLLSIAGFAALGGLVGLYTRSYLAAPVLALVCVGLNVLAPTGPFRSLVTVGTGTKDLIELRPHPTQIALQVGVFTVLLVAALPVRLFTRRARTSVSAVLLAAVLVTGGVFGGSAQPLEFDQAEQVCRQHEVAVCGPAALSDRFAAIGGALADVAAPLVAIGIPVERRFVVLTDGGIAPPDVRAALFIGTEAVRDPERLAVAARRGVTSGAHCDSRSTAMPHDSVVLGRAMLDGWLQRRLGLDQPGTYPTDLVDALEALPAPDVAHVLGAVYAAVVDCAEKVPLPGPGAS